MSLSQSEREALILRVVDYIRQYDPAFNWKIVQEIEQASIREEGRAMVPLLKYSLNEAREEGLKKGIKQGRQRAVKRVKKRVKKS